GTVRPFVTDEVWRRGIVVTSAADANAIPVAEFTLAAIIFAGKKAPFLAQDARTHRDDWSYVTRRGELSNRGRTVGVVGFSRVGRRVVERLRDLEMDVLVSDPYAAATEVSAAGGRLVPLAELLRGCDVLTLHVPSLPETRHLIGAAELALLRDGTTVINTARGAVLDTAAIERECASGRLDAILDVTDPEPLPAGSVLYELPNVMITPHIAGSLGSETWRMSDSALDELERHLSGRPLLTAVTPDEFTVSA
ncbi:hydroxyacid dehydrogenase, partial [Nonomuraea fuscirosea]